MKTSVPHSYIIAEAGVNHNGEELRALELIDIAAACGADAVKFQLFAPDLLVTKNAVTAAYQATNLSDPQISQHALLKSLALPETAFIRLEAHCRTKGIDFLCTPFDSASLTFLHAHTKMRYIKLPSGELINGPFLYETASKGLPILLSTGMSNLDEVGQALSVLYAGYTGNTPQFTAPTDFMLNFLRTRVSLLHCVSMYPAPMESTHLRAMELLSETFGLEVGLSDHTLGIEVSLAAVARGARVIEKHFTYDPKAHGPDHAASLPPQALAEMIRCIRNVEAALGEARKECQPQERNTREVARKSLVALRTIAAGELFSTDNLGSKRPAGEEHISPMHYWQLLGKPAKNAYTADSHIQRDELTS